MTNTERIIEIGKKARDEAKLRERLFEPDPHTPRGGGGASPQGISQRRQHQQQWHQLQEE